MFGFEQLTACREFWTNDENYKLYYLLEGEKKVIHTQKFFEKSEVEFLAAWAGKVYDKTNPEHVSAKDYIMASLGTKTVYWSNQLIKKLPEFDTINSRMWSQKGWDKVDGVNKQVAKFKHYTWARIFKKGDINKDIFFTVGVDANELALVYKLDYYFESTSHLSADQKAIIEKHTPKGLRRNEISIDDLETLDWEKLLDITSTFITENSGFYDKLIALVWGGKDPKDVFSNSLQERTPPLKTYSELPKLNPFFQGVEVDFEKVASQNKELGDVGEQLVVGFEKSKLRKLGRNDLADKVDKVQDGKGFDVLSFDQNGNELFIEVKTTTGSQDTPFYISLNEYLFAELNPLNYRIYRLYNYDEDLNSADFFIIENALEKLLFQPVNYLVYHKQ